MIEKNITIQSRWFFAIFLWTFLTVEVLEAIGLGI